MASSSDSSPTNDSIEVIKNQFRSLYENFNDLMSSKRAYGELLIILNEILKMINGENGIILVESITNSQLLLTNLQKALSDLEQFRVVSTPGEINEMDPDEDADMHQLRFRVIPAEGETSLQSYTEDGIVDMFFPDLTFGELEEEIWPKVNFAAIFIYKMLSSDYYTS